MRSNFHRTCKVKLILEFMSSSVVADQCLSCNIYFNLAMTDLMLKEGTLTSGKVSAPGETPAADETPTPGPSNSPVQHPEPAILLPPHLTFEDKGVILINTF